MVHSVLFKALPPQNYERQAVLGRKKTKETNGRSTEQTGQSHLEITP